jgi:transcriptional regulator with GAF, ATPase, and Fis domain
MGRHRGLFEEADGGTLFLDEIGELPLSLQAKLLTSVEEKRIRRVGGECEIGVDVRILAASNRDLSEEVAAGRFRSDLYHRLSVFQVKLPTLAERPEDIEELVRLLTTSSMSVSTVTSPEFRSGMGGTASPSPAG